MSESRALALSVRVLVGIRGWGGLLSLLYFSVVFLPLSKLDGTGGDVEHGGVEFLAAERRALGVPALL